MLAGKPCQQGNACWQALPAKGFLLASVASKGKAGELCQQGGAC